MDFYTFRDQLSSKIPSYSPNFQAQQLMAPFKMGNRIDMLNLNKNPRLGGVMIFVFNKRNKAHLALIRRPEYDGVHSGQIAFPGGKMDDSDADIQETAIRETFEEIGVPKSKMEILGPISQVYIPPSKFLVTPFVTICNESPVFNKDDFEVEEVLEVPIALLFDDSIVKHGEVNVGNQGYSLSAPYFDVFGHKVWGATAIMLSEFKAIMK